MYYLYSSYFIIFANCLDFIPGLTLSIPKIVSQQYLFLEKVCLVFLNNSSLFYKIICVVAGLYYHGPYPPRMLPGYDLEGTSYTQLFNTE
jgi:hypothetical protein